MNLATGNEKGRLGVLFRLQPLLAAGFVALDERVGGVVVDRLEILASAALRA
ncbi:hypothetical protein [Sulfuricystis multivorans]|uniref:hypothetical protein n=1 Tax=Sulfuricystis multivorans TaxID=2211108 RepID=UPI0015598364|nr:hypothetical protein [Sulfuricystis multivorans]